MQVAQGMYEDMGYQGMPELYNDLDSVSEGGGRPAVEVNKLCTRVHMPSLPLLVSHQ